MDEQPLRPALAKPAEGEEWFGVTGAADATEALAVALFSYRVPGIRMTDEDLHYYRAAAERALEAVATELDNPTPPGIDWERVGPKLVEALKRAVADDLGDNWKPDALAALAAAQPEWK